MNSPKHQRPYLNGTEPRRMRCVSSVCAFVSHSLQVSLYSPSILLSSTFSLLQFPFLISTVTYHRVLQRFSRPSLALLKSPSAPAFACPLGFHAWAHTPTLLVFFLQLLSVAVVRHHHILHFHDSWPKTWQILLLIFHPKQPWPKSCQILLLIFHLKQPISLHVSFSSNRAGHLCNKTLPPLPCKLLAFSLIC